MGKRLRVPAALHSELTEYSSLLRALRTSNTLDLASQLTVPASGPTSLHEDDAASETSLGDESESERPLTETVTDSQDHGGRSQHSDDSAVDELKRNAKRKAKNTKKKAPKDTWTRWPLLAGDVYVTEWSLEDEVRSIATQALQGQWHGGSSSPILPATEPGQAEDEPTDADRPLESTPVGWAPADPDSTSDNGDLSGEESPESLLTPPVLSGLTSSTARFLSQLLALLAAYVPPGEKSMQNRVRPVNWETVLDIAAVNGLVNPETLETIHQRLSAIYSMSSAGAKHNFRINSLSSRARPAEDLSFLDIDGYKPEPPERKRGPYRKRGHVSSEKASRRTSKRIRSSASER